MTIGELLVEINGDNSGLNKTLKGTETTLMSSVGKMVGALGGIALAWKAVDLTIQGINYNKAAEQAEIAFGVFLGSAEAAKNMIEDMRDLAKETPLEFAEVRDAGKRLSAFGVEADKLIPTMRMLADVSSALEIPIGDLSYLFGTIRTQGKAMTVDINQFANRGIPIWEELARVTGKSGQELRKFVESGGVGFPQIEKAFQNMTSEGGKFFQMAVKQMDSLAGAQSNLNDSFDVWLGHMTEGLTGPMKDTSNWLAGMFSGMVALDKEYSKFLQVTNDWAAELFGTKANSEAIFQYWKNLAGTIANDDAAQRKFANTAEKVSIDYPAAFAKNNKDIGKTIGVLASQYGLTLDQIKAILLQTRAVDDKTKGLIKSGLSLTATAVDYADRIKYSNSLQGEAIAAKQRELDRLEELKKTEAVKAKEIQDSNKVILAQAEERANYEWNVIDAYKSASKYIVDNAAMEAQALKEKETGQQIVNGYMMAANAFQVKANDLEREYQDGLDKIATAWKTVTGGLEYASTQFASLSSSAAKFGNTDLSKLLSQISDIAKDVGNFTSALAKGDYIAAAVSGVALLADAWDATFGAQEAKEKKRAERRKEERKQEREDEKERLEAVEALDSKYEEKFLSETERLKKERDERVSYAKEIGANVLQIEAYYAGQIAKVRSSAVDTSAIESEVERQKKEIGKKYDALKKEVISKTASLLKTMGFGATGYIKQQLAELDRQMQEELGQVVYSLEIFQGRAIAASEGLGSALADGLKTGMSAADFRTTIMDMLRNMAIDAAIIASGFQEQFSSIGVMIAEAMKDGFQEGELDTISASIDALYAQAVAAVAPINALFQNRIATPEIAGNVSSLPSSALSTGASPGSAAAGGASVQINIQSNAPLDPLQTAQMVQATAESLAFQGVI